MGAVLTCLGLSSSAIKKSRDKKNASQTDGANNNESAPQQPLPSQAASGAESQSVKDARQALQDEHLATVSPIEVEASREQEHRTEGEVAGIAEVQKEVATAGPLPTATTSKATRPQATGPGEGLAGVRLSRMASDEDYMAFLDKANQDPNESVAKTQGKVELKAVDSGVRVPAALKKATSDAFYVSDADEPFVPVCLKFEGKKLPDEATFAKLVNHPSPEEAEVQILDVGEWDTQGQYKEIVDATREATKGSDVRVYRIGREGSRVEYWVVGLENGKLLGAKALAVES